MIRINTRTGAVDAVHLLNRCDVMAIAGLTSLTDIGFGHNDITGDVAFVEKMLGQKLKGGYQHANKGGGGAKKRKAEDDGEDAEKAPPKKGKAATKKKKK